MFLGPDAHCATLISKGPVIPELTNHTWPSRIRGQYIPRQCLTVPSSPVCTSLPSNMAFLSPKILFTAFVLAVVYIINRILKSNSHSHPLPPGPKGLPLLGNVADLPPPGRLECHYWLKHKDEYGPISSLTVLGQTFIIINDAQIALELLRDRSALHSGRPYMVFCSDMYVSTFAGLAT
jgi:hypothetical protein